MTHPPPHTYPYRLFERFGIELEYMIVDRDTLDVRPICDKLLREASGGEDTADYEPDGPDGIGWCNELALHVVELKTASPARSLSPLAGMFADHVRRVDALLAPMNAMLLPTGMHPWMDPDRELRLWPHENNEIYRTFDRIFSCRGHGWANLQSTHINLPFGDDAEFAQLHRAVRAVLPLLPGLAASTPIMDGVATGFADARLEVYRANSKRIPSVAGIVVPERIGSRGQYEDEVLGRIYRDLEPHDPDGVLRHEWANARGAIARFTRGSIEIRVIDLQECPSADLAVCSLTIALVRALVENRWTDATTLDKLESDDLSAVLLAGIREGEKAVIRCEPLLRTIGITQAQVTVGEAWSHIAESLLEARSAEGVAARRVVDAGTLSSRISKAIGKPAAGERVDRDRLRDVYAELARGLVEDRMFRAD